jgi:hypothetical protein
MEDFFDNLCRSLVAPMRRRRALKIIAGGLAGVIFTPFASGQGNGKRGSSPPSPFHRGHDAPRLPASTSKKCSNACVCPGSSVGAGCCSPGQICWGTGSTQICCSAGYVGASVVKSNKVQITCVQLNASGLVPSNTTLLSKGSTCS